MDLLKKGGSFRAFVGLDGFVDEIVHVVDKRTSPQTYTRVEQMKDFGEAIVSSAGVSTNFEFVSVQKSWAETARSLPSASGSSARRCAMRAASGQKAFIRFFRSWNAAPR